jgi:hypothetical protein
MLPSLLLSSYLASLVVTDAVAAPAQEPRRIALVVGIGSFEKLPAELARDAPRSDAARVAAALETQGTYARVRLLTDASATRENIASVLRNQIATEVGPNDTFLLYFASHGIGADFGEPRLLTYESDPEDLSATSLGVAEFAAQVKDVVRAGHTIILTDAAFEGQLNGLALLGPTANDWPNLGDTSFVMSSAAPRQTAGVGVFARALIEGLQGRADTNVDRKVTSGELSRWMVLAVPDVTGGKQFPTVQSSYDPDLVVAVAPAPDAGQPRPQIDKAKFVFTGVSEPVVTCGPQRVSCDPSCYTWDFTSGACSVSGLVDGKELAGSIEVRYRGAYTCAPFQGRLECSSPPPPRGP